MVPELFRSSLFCAGAEGRAETAAEGEAGVAPAAVTVTLRSSPPLLSSSTRTRSKGSSRLSGYENAYFGSEPVDTHTVLAQEKNLLRDHGPAVCLGPSSTRGQ